MSEKQTGMSASASGGEPTPEPPWWRWQSGRVSPSAPTKSKPDHVCGRAFTLCRRGDSKRSKRWLDVRI